MKNMKNKNWYVCAFMLACGAAVVLPSCSDDDDVTTVTPEFPALQELVCNAGGNGQLAFNAPLDWVLTSSRIWCKLQQGEAEASLTIEGAAGAQTVTVLAGDEVLGFEESEAEISLQMAGVTQVIAKVKRGKDGLVITDGTTAYGVDNPIQIAYNSIAGNRVEVTLNANFDWELKEAPEWMQLEESGSSGSVETLPVKGYADQPLNLTFAVKNEYRMFGEEGNLTFHATNTTGTYTVPVTFDGIPADDLETSLSVWNWKVSADGWDYWQESMGGGDTEPEKHETPVSITVTARENKYMVAAYVFNDWGILPQDPYNVKYINVDDDEKGNIELTFDENTGKEREGYVLVFPQTVVDEQLMSEWGSGVDLEKAIGDDWMSIKEEFERYIVYNFTQEAGEATGGFDVKLYGYMPVECVQGDGGTGLAEYLMSEYGLTAEQIYTVAVDLSMGSYYTIDPLLSMEEWNAGEVGLDAVRAIYADGSSVPDELLSIGMNTPETAYNMSVMCDNTMIILFKDTSMEWGVMYKKALILNVDSPYARTLNNKK